MQGVCACVMCGGGVTAIVQRGYEDEDMLRLDLIERMGEVADVRFELEQVGRRGVRAHVPPGLSRPCRCARRWHW